MPINLKKTTSNKMNDFVLTICYPLFMDWQTFIFNPEHDWISRFDKMARKRFGIGSESLADTAVNDIIKQLSDNNWQALGDINQQNIPEAFLTTVFRHKLEDAARKRFGRPRPPLWIKKLGGIWLTVFERLCLQRQSKQEISFALEPQNQENLEKIISTIKTKHPKCGSPDCQEVSLQGLVEDQHFEPSAENNQNTDEILLFALAQFCHACDDELAQVISAEYSLAQLELSDEQQVLLKLIYQQNLKISQAARILHLPDHQTRKMHKDLLNLLKKCLSVRHGEI